MQPNTITSVFISSPIPANRISIGTSTGGGMARRNSSIGIDIGKNSFPLKIAARCGGDGYRPVISARRSGGSILALLAPPIWPAFRLSLGQHPPVQ